MILRSVWKRATKGKTFGWLVCWLVSNAVGVKKKRQLVGFPNISHHSTSSSPLNHWCWQCCNMVATFLIDFSVINSPRKSRENKNTKIKVEKSFSWRKNIANFPFRKNEYVKTDIICNCGLLSRFGNFADFFIFWKTPKFCNILGDLWSIFGNGRKGMQYMILGKTIFGGFSWAIFFGQNYFLGKTVYLGNRFFAIHLRAGGPSIS